MDELILQRIAEGLYSTASVNDDTGLVFMPEGDPGLTSLTLEGNVTEAGRWLVWSHGPLAPALTQVAPLLKTRDRRIVFSRGPYGGGVIMTGAAIGTIPGNGFLTTLRPDFPSFAGKSIKNLPKIAIGQSDLICDSNGLFLQPKPGQRHRFEGAGVSTAISNLHLAARGLRGGCFVFDLGLRFERLEEFGIRSVVTAEGPRPVGTTVKALREVRPLFQKNNQPAGTRLNVTVAFDPMDGENWERMHFVPHASITLRSRFKGVHGHDVLLTVPAAGTVPEPPRFRLVLNRDEQDLAGSVRSFEASLMPEGPFDLTLAMPEQVKAVATNDTGLAVGDTPHEFLRISPMQNGTPRRLTFRLGGGHVKPDDDSGPGDGVLIGAGRQFEDVTLWAKLELAPSGPAADFISEARALRQLERDQTNTAGVRPRRPDPRPLPGAELGGDLGYVPILPAPNGKPSAADVPVPAQLSSARRRAAMPAAPAKPVTPENFNRSLPQILPKPRVTTAGFEVYEDTEGNIREIVFARGAWDKTIEGRLSVAGRPDEIDPNKPGLVPGDITAAILRNQLFMALDREAALGQQEPEFQIKGQIAISGWGFEVKFLTEAGTATEVAKAAPKHALVLFKGYEGLSIRQLVETINLKLWSGKRYITDAADAARRVRDLHNKITKGKEFKEDPRYDALRAALNDPDWNGVLVLDMSINPSNLPAQIKGLMGGIDKDEFRADHVGFPVQRVRDSGSNPKANPFAAVTYESKPLEPDQSKQYEFNVKKLAAGFAAGKLQDFDCELELRIGQLFGDDGLTLTKNGTTVETNVVTLEGSYERRTEKGSSVEVYKFLSKDHLEIRMQDDFPLIKTLRIDEIGYSAKVIPPKVNGPSVEKVEGKFLIDGDMDFKPLDLGLGDNFDFFDIEKVKFGDLAIDMSFIIDALGNINLPKLFFSPGALRFDFLSGEKKPGGGGFFGSFPLKWKGFGLLSSGLKLGDIDFVSIALKNEFSIETEFFLTFELDMGSFGSLGSLLKDFKMELALAFGFNKGKFALELGMAFPSSPAGSLDINFQGVLELKAKKYELVQLTYKRATGEEGKAWGFRGVEVELKVFNVELPPAGAKTGVYIFSDPGNIDAGVGWLLSTVVPKKGGSIDLRQLTLGQRVDPLPGIDASGERISTQLVLEQLAQGATGMPVGKEVGDNTAEEIEIPDVRYAPQRDWTVGFDVKLFDYLGLGLAIRDPDLAGLRVEVADLFDIDVLYRKLADDLGVYSAEVALAEELRHWQFGAAGITIPVIAFDIYTNGDWGVDLGYPYNKDFTRAFHLNIFPFTGAGGFTFRRVSGPGAKLLPSEGQLKDGTFARYDPITEVQMGARVGLGLAVGGGIFRAGLSLTVYMYLSGAYGRLRITNGQAPVAAPSYILVEGIVGIMGELYGYVDFGIVRAGVNITLWVEAGVLFETDKALRLHYEVGVRVRIRVVIARVCVWRKCFEISVSFSFGTQVRIEQTVGRDNRMPYRYGSHALEALDSQRLLKSLRTTGPAWAQMPVPGDWGVTGPKVPISCVLQPDITLAFAASDGAPEPQAVMLLATQLTDEARDTRSAGPISAAEELVRGLAAWAIKANTTDPTKLTAPLLRSISARIAGDDGAQERNLHALRPTATEIYQFLTNAFDAITLNLPDRGTQSASTEARGALIPLPSSLQIKRNADAPFSLGDFDFVTADYLTRVNTLTEDQLLTDISDGAPGAPSQSVADVLTQEWAALVMRGALGKLADYLDTLEPSSADLDAKRTLAQLITWLGTAHDSETAKSIELRSPAAEVAMQAGRSLIAGPRIPLPKTSNTPDWLENAPQGAEADWFHPLFRLGGMQFPIDPAHGPAIPAGQYGWLTVPQEIDFQAAGPSALVALKAAAETLAQDADAKRVSLFNTHLARAPLFRSRPRHLRLGALQMADAIDNRPLWSLEELQREGKEAIKQVERLRRSNTKDSAPLSYLDLTPSELSALVPAMVLDLSVNANTSEQTNPATETSEHEITALMIQAMEETARALLDAALEPDRMDGPEIGAVKLYLVEEDGTAGNEVGATADGRPVIIKTNPSREVAPAIAARGFRAADRSVVSATDGAAFLELIRQAVIVNTGGFTLLVPQKDLPEKPNQGGGDPLNSGLRLRIVVELGTLGQPSGLASANDPRLEFANRLIGAPASWPEQTVLAADMGLELYPLHQPGVLPVNVTRDPASEQMEEEVELLAQRFSTASFELSFEGNVILARDRSVAVQPDHEEKQEGAAREAADAPLRYRASMAVGQLTGHTASPAVARTEAIAGVARQVTLYDLVGKTVETAVHWRDVYGNLWGNKAAASRGLPMHYCDRMIGIVGLPFLRIVQTPATVNGGFGLHVDLSFDLKAVEAAMGDGMDPGQLRLAADTLQRAAAQLRDTRVTLELGLGPQAETPSTALEATRKGEIIGFLDAMATEVTKAAGGSAPSTLIPLSLAVKVALPDLATPVEYAVALRVKRPAPQDEPGLYPLDDVREALPRLVSDNEVYAALEPFVTTVQDVPIATDATPKEPAVAKPGTTTRPRTPLNAYLDALENAVATSHRVATGRSGHPLGGAAAIWLIPKGMLDKITDGTLSTLMGRAFAFRPLHNSLMSVDFGSDTGAAAISQPPSMPERTVRVVDADVDLETRRVIDYLERLNDPKLIAASIAADKGVTPKLDGFIAACQELRRAFAVRLVDAQLAPVLANQDGAELTKQMRDRVSDRLSRDLTRYDTTGGFLLFPESGVADTDEGGEVYAELILPEATPVGTVIEATPPTLAIQPFSIQIGATTLAADNRRSDVLLSFPVQTENIQAAPPAGLRITHLQSSKRASAGSNGAGYRPTSWLKLHDQVAQDPSQTSQLAGWTKIALSDAANAIIPIRRVPKAPVLVGERFLPEVTQAQPPVNLKAVRQWTSLHRLDIGPMFAQDRLTSRVIYSPGGSGDAARQKLQRVADEPLAIRMLRFGEEIRLIPVEDVYLAHNRGDIQAWLIARFKALVRPPAARVEQLGEAEPMRDTVTVIERKPVGTGELIVTLERLDQVAPKARWFIEDGGEGKELAVPTAGSGAVTHPPCPEPDTQRRDLRFEKLDALVQGDAVSEHWIDRNRKAGNFELRSDFVYTTAIVASGEPVTPVLDQKMPVRLGDIKIEGNGDIDGGALKQQIRRIIHDMLGGAERLLKTDIVIEYESDAFMGTADEWREPGGPMIFAITGYQEDIDNNLNNIADQIIENLMSWALRGPVRDGQNHPLGRLLFDIRIYNATPDGEGFDDTRVLWLRRGELHFPGELNGQ